MVDKSLVKFSAWDNDIRSYLLTSWWFQRFFYFHPENWGRWNHFDSYFSEMVGEKPPTRYSLSILRGSRPHTLRSGRASHSAVTDELAGVRPSWNIMWTGVIKLHPQNWHSTWKWTLWKMRFLWENIHFQLLYCYVSFREGNQTI